MALVSSFDGFIFDYGGVLVAHQTEEDQARMARMAGLDLETFSEAYRTERFDYDKGELTAPEYWQRVAKSGDVLLKADVIDKLTEFDSLSWMQFDKVMWEWIDELRAAGKRVAMLSNMPRDLGESLKVHTDKLTNFDHLTLSYELRAIKPEPAIYEHCLEGLGTAPEKTVFFDDRIANVQGAELLGIHAIQFTSRDEVLLRVRN
jgi:putative hydrolase of the HAD superfamily